MNEWKKYCPKCGGKPKCRQIIYSLESDGTNYSVIGYVCSKCGHLWKPGEGKEGEMDCGRV